jgi:phosphoglycerate dehydrogenase-like enzyme
MEKLRVFCDAPFPDAAVTMLREGVAPHDLVLPPARGASVLVAAGPDPAIVEAAIAFGQPAVEGVRQAKGLRWLQLTSAGFTRYDTPEFRALAAERGLIVTNSSSVYAEACAEHVFAFMLAQARQLPAALRSRAANGTPEWERLRDDSACLRNQRAVILGYGTIAARLVELLAPFRMEITALRRRPQGTEGVTVVTESELAPVLGRADHVINILPDNAASVGFISAERLAQMKPGAIFYNIGRGTTVDQDALAASLRSGRLGAAWLDVTDPEPLPEDHPLRAAPNCQITPHTAGGHHDEPRTLVRHFLDNLGHFLAGRPLTDRIM